MNRQDHNDQDAEGHNGAGLGGEEFEIERLLDYALWDNGDQYLAEPLEPGQEPRWHVRYRVKWLGYPIDPPPGGEGATWEPKSMFTYWVPEYDQTIAELQRNDPSKPTIQALEAQAKKKNQEWGKQLEEKKKPKAAKKFATKATLQGKGKGKGKSKDSGGLAKKSDWGISSASRMSTSKKGTRSTASHVNVETGAERRKRRESELVNQAAFNEYIASGRSRSLRALHFTPPPQRGESSASIQPSFSAGGSTTPPNLAFQDAEVEPANSDHANEGGSTGSSDHDGDGERGFSGEDHGGGSAGENADLGEMGFANYPEGEQGWPAGDDLEHGAYFPSLVLPRAPAPALQGSSVASDKEKDQSMAGIVPEPVPAQQGGFAGPSGDRGDQPVHAAGEQPGFVQSSADDDPGFTSVADEDGRRWLENDYDGEEAPSPPAAVPAQAQDQPEMQMAFPSDDEDDDVVKRECQAVAPRVEPMKNRSGSKDPEEQLRRAKVQPTVASVSACSDNPEALASSRKPPQPPLASKKRPTGLPPTKRQRVVQDDEASAAEPMVVSQRQALQDLKIGRVGQTARLATASPISIASGAHRRTLSVTSAVSEQLSASVSPKTTQKALDSFNYGREWPKAKDGFVVLNHEYLLTKNLPVAAARNDLFRFPPYLVSDVDKIRYLWSIDDNPFDNFVDFNTVMLNDGTPREVYITEPPTAKEFHTNQKARGIQTDYLALQLLLSSPALASVKQADELRPSVRAVFVHATEVNDFRRQPGKLAELEPFRSRDDVVFFMYGTSDDKKRSLMQFWRPISTVTFTPAAIKRDPQRVPSLLAHAYMAREPFLGERNQFPWMPVQYLLPGGAFELQVDEKGLTLPPQLDSDINRRNARIQIDGLLIQDVLALASVSPKVASYPSLAHFPSTADRLPYTLEMCRYVAGFCRASLCEVDLGELQKLACDWRAHYPQVRHWVVLATEDEIQSTVPVPGLTLVTLDDAEQLLSRPLPRGLA
ncbi:hypothetical protein JCM1841_006456 [Sporobolomyces salmonicolor]